MKNTTSIENTNFQYSNQFKELTAVQAVRILQLENRKLREVIANQKGTIKQMISLNDGLKRWKNTYKNSAKFHKREANKLKKQISNKK